MRMLIVALFALFSTGAMADGHLVTLESAHDVKTTADRLEAAINANAASGARVFARIDHAEAAKSVGKELPPTTVVIFGNPNGGTPMMAAQRTIAVDLPLRVLISEIDGKVVVAYHDPAKVAEFHGLPTDHPAVVGAGKALKGLTGKAASQ
ncbi:MAG: DUF302 domain-containing protein [Pseudomonadota bacterium]